MPRGISRILSAPRFAPLLGLGVALLVLSPLREGKAADLVNQPVLAAERAALPQPSVPWATAERDLGEIPDDLLLTHLTVVLRRSTEQQRAFEQMLERQQDPGSPDFHRWLTPLEVGTRFGASAHDIDALTQWLRAQGLQVDAVANSRTRVEFSGSAATVGAAFASRLHAYLARGEQRIAPVSAPQIPAALASLVQSVRGLTTARARPLNAGATAQRFDSPSSAENPAATFCTSGVCNHYVFPGDFAAIYDVNPVYEAGIKGAGETIAIIGRARVYLPDIEIFQTKSNLPVKDPVIIVAPGGIDPGAAKGSGGTDPPQDQVEATADVTRAASVAPAATIDLIISADSATVDGVSVATQYVVDTTPVLAQVMNLSWALCEAEVGQSDIDYIDSLFSQAAAEGISVFVASGDSGAAGCDAYFSAPPATQKASTNYLCASSYATCVGGTEFADAVNPAAYWSMSNSSASVSALGYIPEGVWNEPLNSKGSPQAASSGGGVSLYVPTPAWQAGPGVPGKQGRYTPDVSFSASVHDPYFGCLAAAGGPCTPNSAGQTFIIPFAGTSASAPTMAGVAALLNQKMGEPQGNLNPRLYALAATAGNGVFHDVTVTSSAVSGCDVSVPSMCNNSTPGATGLSGGQQGFLVGPGYDEATGLGSIDVAQLLTQWNPGVLSGVNLDQHGLTGSWYDPATNGQGLEIEVYPDLNGPGQGLLFSDWFTYDVTASGGRRWYALSGNISSADPTGALQIFAEEGGNLNAPPIVNSTSPVGQATIHFSDCVSGLLTYNFTDGSGRSGIIPLTRLTPNVTCSRGGDNGNAPTDYLLSGNWFNPNTSGQGFIFDVSPSIGYFFAAWYTFAPDGQQLSGPASQDWFTLQSSQFVDGTTTLQNIPIIATTGGVFNNATPTTSSQVGTATVAFQNCNAMTLNYAFTAGANQGKNGSINMIRVGPTPAGCAL